MNTKEYMNTIKETIKKKEAEQRFYKNQRKTVRLVGERKLEASDAAYKAFMGKEEMTELYIAYYCTKHRIPMDEENKERVLNILIPNHKGYHNFWYYAKKHYDKWQEEFEKISKESAEQKRRLYILIDKSLDKVYGCVQGGHAVAQYLIEHKNGWKNQYLIYLYADVERWKHKLDMLGIDHSVFREPDLANKITSIAVENDGKLFKNLQLVK